MHTPILTVPVLALILGLSACAATGGGSGDLPPLTPLTRYAMRVEPGLDRIALAVHAGGVSPTQGLALRDLAARWRGDGTGRLFVQVPSGEDPTASAMASAVRDALVRLGIPDDRILVEAYAAPDATAPVLVGFETVQAAIPNCAAERGTLNGRITNGASPGLGCSVNANLAAQIDDPRDIMRPRGMTPSDSGRAAVVFQAYRAGETTSAAPEELVAGRIARAVE